MREWTGHCDEDVAACGSMSASAAVGEGDHHDDNIDYYAGSKTVTGSGSCGADGEASSFYGLSEEERLPGLIGTSDGGGGADGTRCLSCPVIESAVTYWVHVVGEDASGNLMSEATLLPWFTTPDDAPPKWVTLRMTGNAATIYDHSPNAGGVTIRMTAALSETGRVYFAAFASVASDGVNPPSPSPVPPPPSAIRACALKAMRGGARDTAAAAAEAEGATEAPAACAGMSVDIPGADGVVHVDIDGLDSETTFFVYAAAEDSEDLRPPHPYLLERGGTSGAMQAELCF